MNGFDVQSDAEAMLERQRRDIIPRMTNTPRTPATPASGLRLVSTVFIYLLYLFTYLFVCYT